MISALLNSNAMIGAAAPVQFPIAAPTDGMTWAGLILLFPAIAAVLCGLCMALRVKSKAPAWITVGFLGASFIATLALFIGYESPVIIHLFDWFNLGGAHAASDAAATATFVANFSFYVDSLTLLWMLFVTGLGTLIALYASEYMEHDVGAGYARFFAGVSIFLFAMSALVMGDNLVMLYLGWEGVGLASYLLIGYFYQKPSAVAAAKKAFIMNRIGDLGLALAIFLIWHNFGTVEYRVLFEILQTGTYQSEAGGWSITAIPYLLMLGAFGKSAQLPLYVWLPDAMEGPTPVSALIHAATMVTAGVYLLARMAPTLELHPYAPATVAWIGGLTALLAATIGMAQYDIKRIMAYSTVSQLGYMFAGIGVLTTFGAAYHVFTHAFFKAVLFLTCGAIMHGFAGQLDLRKLSGLRHMDGWKITSYTMLIGCLCLAGFPLTSGFFSKDVILAEAFAGERAWLGWLLLFTAMLTAYYTFRVWFRVCAGPVQYEAGDEHHGDNDHGDGDFHPHAPRLAINAVLVIITIGAVLAAIPYFMPGDVKGGWVAGMVADSSALAGFAVATGHGLHGTILGFDPHKAMYVVSGIFGLVGIGIAYWLHLANRRKADELRASLLANPGTRWLPTAMENKWYVDEIYHAAFRAPLWAVGHLFSILDYWVLDRGIVDGIAKLPRALARVFQPLHNGVLQSYAVSMAGGAALVALLVLLMPDLLVWLNQFFAGGAT